MSARPSMPSERTWLPLVEFALEEDLGPGDATSALVVDTERSGGAVIEARESLVVCGLSVAEAVFAELDPDAVFTPGCDDGARAEPGQVLAKVDSRLRGILAAERTALNFLARMSGVATWTRRFVDAVEGTGVRIVDTRKTLPAWRVLDKYATAIGGALNHRVGLFDGILLKDNHLALAGGVALAVKTARAAAPAHLRIQVEVESEEDAVAAIEAGADLLLLDNLPPPELRRIAARLADRVPLEASGGIHLDNVREFAETGVHRISIGGLTHSAPAVDIALEMAEAGDAARGVRA